jgi:hypothetical protein
MMDAINQHSVPESSMSFNFSDMVTFVVIKNLESRGLLTGSVFGGV